MLMQPISVTEGIINCAMWTMTSLSHRSADYSRNEASQEHAGKATWFEMITSVQPWCSWKPIFTIKCQENMLHNEIWWFGFIRQRVCFNHQRKYNICVWSLSPFKHWVSAPVFSICFPKQRGGRKMYLQLPSCKIGMLPCIIIIISVVHVVLQVNFEWERNNGRTVNLCTVEGLTDNSWTD